MTERAPMVWGFDVALNFGVAEGRVGETPRLYSVKLGRPDDDDFDAGSRAIKWIVERMKLDTPDLVVIERPIISFHAESNDRSKWILSGLVFLLGSILRQKRIRVQLAAVSSIRKTFLGNGRLKSDIAKRQAFELSKALGWAPPNRDASDAAAAWHHGCLKIAPDLAHRVDPLLIGLNEGAGA